MKEFVTRLQEREYTELFIYTIEGELCKIPRSLFLLPSHGEDSNEGPLLLLSHYNKIWYNIKISRIISIFSAAVEKLLPNDNPFCESPITKCMRQTKNLKDFVDAINSAMTTDGL